MSNKIVIETDKIEKIQLAELAQEVFYLEAPYFLHIAKGEHYKLLAYLSNLFNLIKIADIGTRHGSSAVALSYNPLNQVDSYDIIEYPGRSRKLEIQFYQEDLTKNLPKLLQYRLIFLDIDPHDGAKEKEIIEFLQKNDWKGLLILDDILLGWPQLTKVWNDCTIKKHDLTPWGHFSGTGLIDYSGMVEII